MTHISLQNRLYKAVEGVYNDGKSNITLHSCRGTVAAFQILIKNDDGAFALAVGDRPYMPQKMSKKVIRVCGDGVTIGIQKYQTVEGGRRIADAILHTDACEFDLTAALFVTLDVAKDAPKCIRGSINVFEHVGLDDEIPVGVLQYEVIVSDYVMKDASEFSMHLDLWQHLTSVARAHGAMLFSDRHFALLRPYIDALSFLGQKCITLVMTDMPWGGQSCFDHLNERANLFEHQIVQVKKTNHGFEYDFSVMRRYIDLCFDCGITSEIELIGLIGVWSNGSDVFDTVTDGRPDKLRVRYTDVDGCARYMHKKEDIDAYVRAVEKYFIDEGLADRVRVCADEPADVDAYRDSVQYLHALAPSFRFKSAINHAEFIAEFKDTTADFVPYIDCLAREYDTVKSFKQTLSGKRFLWYVCCGPHNPNTFIRSPLQQAVFIGAFTSFADMDGFLRWSYCLYTDDPMREQNYHIFPAGDLGFVYPAADGGVLLSTRYYALRLGVELYELLQEAKRRGIDVTPYYNEIIIQQDVSMYRYGQVTENNFMINDTDRLLKIIYDIAEAITKS